jgi:hypothetical protein
MLDDTGTKRCTGLGFTGLGSAFGVSIDAGSFVVACWSQADNRHSTGIRMHSIVSLVSGAHPATVGTAVGFPTLQSTLAQPARFQAARIDVGFFNWTLWRAKNVKYQ